MDQFRNTFPWKELISKEYSLEETSDALVDVEKLNVVKAVIKPNA